MVQMILLGAVFTAAVFYLGRLVYLSFKARKSCTSGCGKCGPVPVAQPRE